jgi:hypothetical protein
VNARSTASLRYLSSVRREVATPLKRSLPWALLVGILGALIAAGASAGVAAAHHDGYTASATFDVITRIPKTEALSRNRGLIAEQVARGLESGRADEIAARATKGGRFTGEWVTGPAFGEVSYKVESTDPEVAMAAAQAVHDEAGFLGSQLVRNGQEWPALDLLEVTKATPTEPAVAKTVTAGAVLGGFSGFALVLLFAVPMRRPTTA